MGRLSRIGQRRFTRDWGSSLLLFDKLVWTVLSYRVGIWGWGERKKLERLQERYLQWVMGVGRETSEYMLREESKSDELGIGTVIRRWRYDKRLQKEKGRSGIGKGMLGGDDGKGW
ncbi:hypothetical protein KM043_013357 [Ampulex compressa]|nr:hypothetical protein KM043_013357 [Ampulex compressa]